MAWRWRASPWVKGRAATLYLGADGPREGGACGGPGGSRRGDAVGDRGEDVRAGGVRLLSRTGGASFRWRGRLRRGGGRSRQAGVALRRGVPVEPDSLAGAVRYGDGRGRGVWHAGGGHPGGGGA